MVWLSRCSRLLQYTTIPTSASSSRRKRRAVACDAPVVGEGEPNVGGARVVDGYGALDDYVVELGFRCFAGG